MRHAVPVLLAVAASLAAPARAQRQPEPAEPSPGPDGPPASDGGSAAEERPGEEPPDGDAGDRAPAIEGEPEAAPWYRRPQPGTLPAEVTEPPPGEPQPSEQPAPGDADRVESDDDGVGDDDPHAGDSGWALRPIGLLRAGYEYVFDDERYDFVGDNSGFILGNARIGIAGGSPEHGLSFRINVDADVGVLGIANTPEATLGVAVRDAFARWDFVDGGYLGATIGQFKVPFMAGWLGRDGALPFASRAVGLDGVPVGRGFELGGIVVDREIGLSLGSNGRVPLIGDFGVGYYLTAFNGNGLNQILNDNVAPAVAGRVELYWSRFARLGAAVLWNLRTVGPLPDRFEEEDVGFSGDLSVDVVGIEFVGHVTLLRTSFPTVGVDDRTRLEFHLQAGYDLPFVEFPFVVGYRFAYYDPWQSGGAEGAVDLSAFELMYHTVGLRVEHPVEELRLTGWLNYTFTVETDARALDNDRIEAIVQLAF